LIDLDLTENIFFDVINYRTNPKKTSNIKAKYNVKNKKFIFKSINFIEDKNTISVKDLVINNKNEIEKISSIKILTFKNEKENNNFIINFGKKISISGKKYDSSNLLKLLSKPSKSNPLKNFNKEVEIQIKNLITKSNIPLSNFNLIGLAYPGRKSLSPAGRGTTRPITPFAPCFLNYGGGRQNFGRHFPCCWL
jgi:hypothetical protein